MLLHHMLWATDLLSIRQYFLRFFSTNDHDDENLDFLSKSNCFSYKYFIHDVQTNRATKRLDFVETQGTQILS